MKKILPYLIASSLCITVASCSVFSPKGKANKPVVSNTIEQTDLYDEENPNGSASAQPSSIANENQIEGEWKLFAIKGKKVEGENRPVLIFNLADHRLYGNNGCNVINADFAVEKGNTLTISNLITSMALCHDAPYEQAVNEGLTKVRNFGVSRRGHEYYLELTDSHNKSIFTWRKHNMEFINGSWSVKEAEGEQWPDNEESKMVIDIQEKSIHGNTGCNLLNGDLLIDPDKSYSIQFQNIATTRKMCTPEAMKREMAFLVALEKVEYARKGKNNTIVMTDKENKPVLILKRLELKQDDE
ncbi:MAG: META domain-containing protein [Muribaculum sp.]|nr:META domain-containing protein [Muribaculaceae bacterium]MCM1080615.1 META domain-containing protein [Muribaculum sp.]